MNKYQKTINQIVKDELRKWGYSNPTNEQFRKARKQWKDVLKGKNLEYVVGFKNFINCKLKF